MSSTAQNLQFLEAMLTEYLHTHEDSSGNEFHIRRVGIRLPHAKTLEGLEPNMKYIEALLTAHLHDHEVNEASESGIFVIKPTGFRFPFRWEIPGAIRQNAQFLQEQLTEYLHKHEVSG